MGTAWTRVMVQVAASTQALGGLVEAGGDGYRLTDETAMPAGAKTAGRVGNCGAD